MNIVLFTALPDAAGAEAPKWVHLVPIGEFRGVDGRGPYRLTDMQAVIAASMARGKIPVDENHATDYAMTTGQPSPARGWIVDMQAREDGIWAEINWTPSGTVLMSEHAYNGISPVMAIDKADRATMRAILRAALTNTPNIGDLPTLHSQEAGMDLATLRTTLGLPAEADEAAILARVTANATAVTLHSQEIVRLAEAAGAAASVTTADGLVTVLASQRANAGDTTKMARTIVTLQSQVDTMEAERGRDRATSYVDAQIAAGKPIRAIRDHYITRHMARPADVETELTAMPSLHAGGIGGAELVVLQARTTGEDWTPEEKMSCEKMGVSKEAFMANKKKRAAEKMGAA